MHGEERNNGRLKPALLERNAGVGPNGQIRFSHDVGLSDLPTEPWKFADPVGSHVLTTDRAGAEAICRRH